jgi:hypothetical protein
MIDAATTEAKGPAEKEVNTVDGGSTINSQPGSGSDNPAAATAQANPAGDNQSPQVTAQPVEDAGPEFAGLPHRRRGILLGTHAEAPAAADDGKSLSWMATQAVKALNAVKASQQEQLQTLKARADMSEDEAASGSGENEFGADTGESAGVPGEYDPMMAEPPAMNVGVAPPSVGTAGESAGGEVEDSQDAVPPVAVPAAARRAPARGAPRHTILILAALVAIGLLGYRHWSASHNAASDLGPASSATIEPTGPATGMDITPPRISVVAAPVPASGRAEPPTGAVGTAPPALGAAAASRGGATVGASESAAPAGSPGSASGAAAPQAAPENAPSTVSQEEGQRRAVSAAPAPTSVPAPAFAPTPAPATAPASAPMPAPATASGSAPTPAPASASASAPAPVPAPAPASAAAPAPAPTTGVVAKQPEPPTPASPPRYPARGYGYYPPSSSWQPYYRPAYPQYAPR